jgi:hypothetical protein
MKARISSGMMKRRQSGGPFGWKVDKSSDDSEFVEQNEI